MELKVLVTLTFWRYFQLGYAGEIALREIARNCAQFIAIIARNLLRLIARNILRLIARNRKKLSRAINRNILRAVNRNKLRAKCAMDIARKTASFARN